MTVRVVRVRRQWVCSSCLRTIRVGQQARAWIVWPNELGYLRPVHGRECEPCAVTNGRWPA